MNLENPPVRLLNNRLHFKGNSYVEMPGYIYFYVAAQISLTHLLRVDILFTLRLSFSLLFDLFFCYSFLLFYFTRVKSLYLKYFQLFLSLKKKMM